MKILLTIGAFIISALAAASGAMAYTPATMTGSPAAVEVGILSNSAASVMDSSAQSAVPAKMLKVADGRRRGRRHRRSRNGAAAGAVALGVFGAIVAGALSEEAAAEEARRCGRLERRCDRGSDYACEELYATCE